MLGAVAARDANGFRQLYETVAPQLFGTILRITRRRSVAEEILQDVFVRIWQNAVDYTPTLGAPYAWLHTIARNRAIDVIRQRDPAAVTGLEEPTDWFERIAEGRDREADFVNVASLRHCLGELDPEARRCVLLAYFEGYSRNELAEQFDRPVGTIKTWLHRSLASLRACLDGGRP